LYHSRSNHCHTDTHTCMQHVFVGFLEKEIVKDRIEILDTGENPEAPASREMSDLEVCFNHSVYRLGQKSNRL